MDITLFSKPETQPYGMLGTSANAYQKEQLLAWFLSKCIEAGAFGTVKTKYTHPTMVEDGLLEEVEGGYKLTIKAIGLLYSVYGKAAEYENGMEKRADDGGGG